jgi:hypothetical protein
LKSDVTTGRMALKADFSDIKNLLVAHPSLIASSAQVTKDYTHIGSEFTAFKAGVAQLKSDLG